MMFHLASDHYVWFVWSSTLLIPWVVVYALFPEHRKAMVWSSLFTTPLGLTEPIYVPEYWLPPSLFDLAQTTGFDIESLIFCFGLGGVASVAYNLVYHRSPKPVDEEEKYKPLHQHHYASLAAPFIAFGILYWLPWNPIYPSIIAMFIGAWATISCRPDLKARTWVGGILFLIYYAIFLTGLELGAPGYIERVWNLDALSGIRFGFMPLEELLFAIGVGMYWAGVYEHFNWKK
jgi:hypothetical protein